jgi:predicted MarR family transcription regulator
MTPGGDTQTDDDEFWNALGDRAIHPVRVEIIEALRRIGRAVRTPDLLFVLDNKHVGLRVEYHLRQLKKLKVVEAGKREGPIRSYRLAERLRS